jgi:hypothetical protein
MNRALCFFLFSFSAFALEPPTGCIQFNWDKLAANAVEKVDVNLEGSVLQMASSFLSGKGDESKIKQMVQGLKCVYVKSFTYAKEGQYSEADLGEIRSYARGPGWSKIVDAQEKNESSTIYLKTDGKQTQGILIVAGEAKELTVVQIIGPIDPSMLNDLGGKMGIPKIDVGSKPAPSKKDD